MTQATIVPRATPLASLHRARQARMAAFAGWDLPLFYPDGIIAEVRQCRRSAVLFDICHMGQIDLPLEAAAALEVLTPADLATLPLWRQRYSALLTESGGIIDDVMIARLPDRWRLVVNASRTDAVLAHFAAHLPTGLTAVLRQDQALLAVQGPAAATELARLNQDAAALPWMGLGALPLGGTKALIARCGYTGCDGFEIAVPVEHAAALATALLDGEGVSPAGLGARDALRLEAGLCLYGQDIDTSITLPEANLAWVISKRRRIAWDFIGGAALRAQMAAGPPRLRVGIRPEGAAPARAGVPILDQDGTEIGQITSGGFSPTLGAPIAMGMVPPAFAAPGTRLSLKVRGQTLPAHVAPLPFVPHTYPTSPRQH